MLELTKAERAYLAGYFDGEGTFSITKKVDGRNPDGYAYQPFISISSTKREVIDYLHERIGKGFTYWTPRKGNANDAFMLTITGAKTIIEFIDLLAPYLILKKKIAQSLKDYCLLRKDVMSRPNTNNQRGYGVKELELFDEIRCLNKRGRN